MMDRIEGTELQVGYCEDCGQAKQFQTSGGGWNSRSLMNGQQMNVHVQQPQNED